MLFFIPFPLKVFFYLCKPLFPCAELHHGQTYIQFSDLLLVLPIPTRPGSLSAQRIHLPAHLSDDILNPQEILFGPLHLLEGFTLSLFVFGDPCCFFNEVPPVLRTGIEQQLHLSLLDN